MKQTVTIDGLRELEQALAELPKATAKNVMQRVLLNRSRPIVAAAKSIVRVDQGHLRDSIGAGTKLTRRQSSLQRAATGPAAAEVYVGAGGLTQAITEEFGTVKQEPHPFMRPAWEAGRMGLLEGLKKDLWSEIKKAAGRLAAKAARRRG